MTVADLLERFDVIAQAPGGVQKLRELVLTLAVQGKLVAQDPADEPASVLLARIKAEKAARLAQGKGKKEKPLAPIADEEKPFELPSGWEWVRLSEIIHSMDAGWSPACEAEPAANGEWGVLKTTAVQVLEYLESENKRLPSSLKPRPENEVVDGDILITRAGPKNRVGICCVATVTQSKLMISDKIIRFHPFEGVAISDYLALSLNAGWSKELLEQAKSGMAESQMNISQTDLKNICLALPPIEEQSRIVAKVEQLMTLIDRLEAAQTRATATREQLAAQRLARLAASENADDFAANWQALQEQFELLLDSPEVIDQLQQTLLQLAVRGKLTRQYPADEPAAVLLERIRMEKAARMAASKGKKEKPLPPIDDEEEPFELPDGWKWARLGDVGITSTGKTPSTSNSAFFNGHLAFIGPAQISISGKISVSEKWLTDLARTETSIAKPGDVLMVCIGGSIGKSGIVDQELAFNQQINCIQVLVADYRYIFNSVSTSYFLCQVWAAATGSATPIINRSKWESLLIPLPPLAEQSRIVAKVEQLTALCTALKSRLDIRRINAQQLAEAALQSLSN